MKTFLLKALFVILGIPLFIFTHLAWLILPLLFSFSFSNPIAGVWTGLIIGIIILVAAKIVEYRYLDE